MASQGAFSHAERRYARICPNPRRCEGSFWPKAGACPKWSKSEALPGVIFGPKRALGRSGQNPSASTALFCSKVGAGQEYPKSERLHGLFCDKHDVHPSGFGISFLHPHLTSFFLNFAHHPPTTLYTYISLFVFLFLSSSICI